jgi:dipeptidyl aminopeptidase/acylaminoacyl peptidase
VEETPDLPEGKELPETIDFSVNAFITEDNQILVKWDTSWLMNSRIEWTDTLPQTELVGPTLLQEKINFTLNTSHEITTSDLLPGETYYIRISGIPWGSTDNEYLFAENTDSSLGQWWEVIIPDTPEEVIESNESQTTSETSFNLYTYNSDTGQLLKIDPQTGQAVIMHNLSQKNSFADLSVFSNPGSLISIGHFAPDTQLYQINLLTGEVNLIGETGLNFVEGVEYIPSTGQLFAGGRKRPHHTNDSYLFIKIDPSNGSVIRQQKTNIRDIDSLAYNLVSGELWAVDSQPNRYVRFWTVDLETGQGTLKKAYTKKDLLGYSGLIGISFSPNGQAYGLLYNGTKSPIKEYRLTKIDMNDFSFELLPAENLGQPETMHLTNITSN